MRWLYPDPNDIDEKNLRDRVIKDIDAWWRAFAEEAPTIRKVFKREASLDLPKWMHDNLQCIHPNLCWEFGPGIKKDGDRLVITPESSHALRPLVREILKRQPDLPDWEFYEYRQIESLSDALQSVRGRTRGDVSGARVTVRRGAHNLIDVVYHHPRFDSSGNQSQHEAFVLTESLLGEEVLDRWIGLIDAEPMKEPGALGKLFGAKNPQQGIAIEQLKPTVDALISSIQEQLPTTPVRDWAKQLNDAGETLASLLKMPDDPPEQEDYPGWSDLIFAMVEQVELFSGLHSGFPVHSPRYSRIGEIFCYLKIDHSDQQLPVVEFRSGLEDPLASELHSKQLASHFGGGTGKKYAYIFLALQDVLASIDVIRQTLRAHLAPKRSWLLFYDANLGGEWIGVWDDTPAPPG